MADRLVKKRSRNYDGNWRKTPDRIIGTSLVRFYQLTLSGFIGNHCRHLPTCSEYAYEAIARYGLWIGSWLTFFRLIRCGPFGTHGFDPVPNTLDSSFHWYMPWRYWKIAARKHE